MALVEVRNLKKYFNTPDGLLHAVDNVTFSIQRGHTVGLAGESGCGKSTLGRTLVHLHESTSGQILFDGRDITHVNKRELKEVRGKMQMIFQDPYSSLNPRMTVEDAVREPMVLSRKYASAEISEKTLELMKLVGIDRRMRQAYPHELDGGRRQRVGIARALAMDPEFIVCDEPVSALDVSIQAQILNLLQDLQEQKKLTYLFVTHDMSVLRHISDDICIMYLGQMVEMCEAEELFHRPLHPYTQALLSAIPSTDIDHPKQRIMLEGEIVSPVDPKPGCRFAARCPYASKECGQDQELKEVSPGHLVACCRLDHIMKSQNKPVQGE
ncbi:MAG: ATP-binding cassette domain-containing protein [Lachnospiraceae bacterium]|nr:ATP-binding cassette domain-containing protein [Lachnospiraceae bacterium]